MTTAHMAVIGRLKHVSYLVLGETTDEGLAQLAGHGCLSSLALDASQMGDQGLASLATLPKLSKLSLWGGKFSGHGFGKLKKLWELDLARCTIPADLVAQLGPDSQISESDSATCSSPRLMGWKTSRSCGRST